MAEISNAKVLRLWKDIDDKLKANVVDDEISGDLHKTKYKGINPEKIGVDLNFDLNGQEKVNDKMIDKLDIDNISRGIESLKERSQWLEENIQKIDIRPLREKIDKIEELLREMKASSPYIIE